MSKLHKYAFSDLYDIASGLSSTKEQAGHGSPFASFSTVFNNIFLPAELPDLMQTSEKEQEIYSIKKGDILITRTSETVDELAMSCVALKDYPQATYSGFVKRLRPKTTGIAYDKFMAFFLRSKYFRKVIDCNTIMTLRASFNEDMFSFLNLYLPDYEEQVKIGDLLYNIERKIQNNKVINDNLAEQAKLIFDKLFPSICSGEMHIGDYVIPKRGTALLSKDVIDGEIPVIAGGIRPSTYNNQANTQSPVITISASGANAGYINLWTIPVWSSDSSFIDASSTPYVYFWYEVLKRYQQIIFSLQSGSAQPHIYPNHIANLPIAEVDPSLVSEYEMAVSPLFSMVGQLEKESIHLRRIRDWLLPMLMNGQATI